MFGKKKASQKELKNLEQQMMTAICTQNINFENLYASVGRTSQDCENLRQRLSKLEHPAEQVKMSAPAPAPEVPPAPRTFQVFTQNEKGKLVYLETVSAAEFIVDKGELRFFNHKGALSGMFMAGSWSVVKEIIEVAAVAGE